MKRSLFTELSITDQESLSGGADYRFNKDKWDCYKYYNKKYGGTYYKCYPNGNSQNDGGDFVA